MHVSGVTIRGFKSAVTIDFDDLPPIALLVGPNNVGKSAILEALSYMACPVILPNEPPHVIHDVAPLLTALEGVTPPAAATLNLTLHVDEWDPLPEVLMQFHHGIIVSTDQQLTRLQSGYSHSMTRFKVSWLDQTLYDSTASPYGTWRERGIELSRDLVETWLAEAFGRWRIEHVPAFRKVGGETYAPTTQLIADGSNLKSFLRTIRDSDYKRKGIFASILSEFTRITNKTLNLDLRADAQTTPSGVSETLHLLVRDRYYPEGYDLEESGDGLQELLILIAVITSAPRGALVAIEEPELHLHADAQRRLWSLLQSRSRDLQFIVATHSPIFIDAAEEGGLYKVERTRGFTSVTPTPRQDTAELLWNLGMRWSDYLTTPGFVFVEGKTDAELFGAWAHQSGCHPQTIGADFVPINGVTKLPYYVESESLTRLRTAFGELQNLFIIDRHDLSDEALEHLVMDIPGMVILERREVENYLLDPRAVASRVLERAVSERGLRHSWSKMGQMASMMENAANTLRGFVALRRLVPTVGGRIDRDALLAVCADVDLESPATVRNALNRLQHSTTEEVARRFNLDDDHLRRVIAEVDGRWQQNGWQVEAPGGDVLRLVFRQHGLTFSKADLLAIGMTVDPPAEVVGALREYLRNFGRAPRLKRASPPSTSSTTPTAPRKALQKKKRR